MFVVLEGIDGAGKSTQIELLADWLAKQGQEVVCCADPGTTGTGLAIRKLLLSQSDLSISPVAELMLFFAARAQLVSEVIRPALESGKSVVCDRFLLSSVVYQGYLGQIPPQKIWQQSELVLQGCFPDLMIVLDLPASVAATRASGRPDRIESRGQAYLESVRSAFQKEVDAAPGRLKMVDATLPPEEVSRQIFAMAQKCIPKA